MAFCPACGGWILDEETICYQCGYRLQSPEREYGDEEENYF